MELTDTQIAFWGLLFSGTVIGVTAVWKLSAFLRDRPSRQEVKAMLESVHKQRENLASRVARIEIVQAEQGTMIRNIDRNVEKLLRRHETGPVIKQQ